MSAAAPFPPPGPSGSAMNGYHPGARPGGDDWRLSDGAPSPPISQISASASEHINDMKSFPIARLLEVGRSHFTKASIRVSSRGGLAATYWDYMVAYLIVVEAIPRHRDYYDRIKNSRSGLHRDYKELSKDVQTDQDRFMRIKDMIVNENKRMGVHSDSVQNLSRPSSTSSQYTTHTNTSNSGSRLSNGSLPRQRDDELMLPDVPNTAPTGRVSPVGPSESPRRKPQVHPKPQALHGRALHQSIPSTNGATTPTDLAERFAKLRGTAAPIDTSNAAAEYGAPATMPSPSDYHTSSRPTGPRDMPPLPPPNHAPPRLPKLPLNTQMASSLPKAPSPTYSPARNMALPPSISAPRSSARSIVGTGGRSNSLASSVSAHPPGSNNDSNSYFPRQEGQPPHTERRKSINKPLELQVPAEKLYDYIRMFNVLLIDVRSREEFDSGHIPVHAIICIEPTALQDGLSADQLHDRLVLSPDDEQALYTRRDDFDLVVYYDESTKTNSFLQKHTRNEHESALKRLYDTLYEFNAEKPLKRPPIFLMGGIDAWTDLVGAQALATSTTATLAAGQSRSTRPLRRAPAVSHGGRAHLQKRRMREYTPMDPEEERKWMEEARRGRAVFEEAPAEDEEDAASAMFRTTEDFLRRYPEVDVEQQSMVYPPPRPPGPPQYPAPPIPVAPSRPAPSVSRVSYSGVHERQNTPQGRAPQLSMYVSSRHGQYRLHRTGLINFGVTCYMNSVIQCLSANMDLTNVFLTGSYTGSLQRNNWKGSKGLLTEAYATLLSNLYKGDVGALRPSTFRKLGGYFNSQWGVDQQQDAKEYLEFVLDYMHEDLNITWDKPPLKQLTEVEEQKREKLPRPYAARIEWNRYLHREHSYIGQLFAGQHASRLQCTTCGFTSTTYEAFWSISVEIPRTGTADIRDCLRSYCSTERLDGDDIWRCPRCKKDREANKTLTITRAPNYLTIHFKRFRASKTEGPHKVRTPIEFPLQGLDLGPFVNPPITADEEAQVFAYNARDGETQLSHLKQDLAMSPPYLYNAYAVIWHIGGNVSSGHYIALVKDKSKGCWRSFNDDKITDIEPGRLAPENRLQNERAYIVFYEREQVAGGV
ncbi:cysteine proteinase [Polyplosphaeria fusca]|uniref:Cysteine proteinase n=1 Tax=Polyplosphaeria fusca TaxID=682080 RepID=A0A9P4QRK1_9PLEO|nr:cysteine proteinase [Polyplosphaeria fusca]